MHDPDGSPAPLAQVRSQSECRVLRVDDVLTLIKKMCNLRATWEEATAGLERQAAASD